MGDLAELGDQVVQQGVAGDTFYAVLSGTFWLGAGVGLGLGLGSG